MRERVLRLFQKKWDLTDARFTTGVNVQSGLKWKELRRRLVEDAYESVMEGLAKNAMAAKSPKWVELYLKATGKYKDQEGVQVNVSNNLGQKIKQDGVTSDILTELDAILRGNSN